MPAAVGTWDTHLTVPNSASVLLFPSGTQPMLRPCPALSPPWAHQLLSHARQTPTQGAWPRAWCLNAAPGSPGPGRRVSKPLAHVTAPLQPQSSVRGVACQELSSEGLQSQMGTL